MRIGWLTQARWERITEWPLAVAAVLFVVVYGWEVIADLRGAPARPFTTATWILWAVFVVDYVISLVLAERRWHWFTRHLLDLAMVVLPALRPLRLLRLLSLLGRFHRSLGRRLRGRVALYVGSYATVLVLIAAIAELGAEQNHPGSSIRSLGDSLWWAVTTVTTVGYGDYTPVTVEGRLIGVALMIVGVGVIGTVTATVASWLVQQASAESENETQATLREVAEVRHELRRLTALLGERDVTAGPGSATDR